MSDDSTSGNVPEAAIVDGGTVIINVGDPQLGKIPVPLPEILQQLFGILGDLDQRLMALEEEKKKSGIITL